MVILNAALSVRTERHQAVEGKTPEISIEQARRLLKAIDCSRDVGRRDWAVIGILIYAAARVGAVAILFMEPQIVLILLGSSSIFVANPRNDCSAFSRKGFGRSDLPKDTSGIMLQWTG